MCRPPMAPTPTADSRDDRKDGLSEPHGASPTGPARCSTASVRPSGLGSPTGACGRWVSVGEQGMRCLRERALEHARLVQPVAPVGEEQDLDAAARAPAAQHPAQRLAGADAPKLGIGDFDDCLDSRADRHRVVFLAGLPLGHRDGLLGTDALHRDRGRLFRRHIEERGSRNWGHDRHRDGHREGHRGGQPKSTKRRARRACSAARFPALQARTARSAA